jgi:hypothetical protein
MTLLEEKYSFPKKKMLYRPQSNQNMQHRFKFLKKLVSHSLTFKQYTVIPKAFSVELKFVHENPFLVEQKLF